MPIYKLKLINRKEIANATILLEFEKPVDFVFQPGQYGGFTLMNQATTDLKQLTRRFSILSIPSDEHISIVTKMQPSPYKEMLKNLQIGSEIKLAGPQGAFTLHEDKNVPAVFIAGGIGISPFFSMIRHELKQKSPREMILFYGNQSLQDTAFFNELADLQKENTNFKCVTTFLKPEADWQGEVGFITDDMIYKNVRDLSKPIFYICGSPVMVNALHATLRELEIPEDRIKVEDFPGY